MSNDNNKYIHEFLINKDISDYLLSFDDMGLEYINDIGQDIDDIDASAYAELEVISL